MEKQLTPAQQEQLIGTLQDRFKKHMNLHEDITWDDVHSKIEAAPEKIWSLFEMERTGGEPDVVGYDSSSDEYIFADCSAESPKGRRSTCYDNEALESRKKYKPERSAVGMADEMGITLLTEDEYRNLQKLGTFDTKTSSWIQTPDDVRSLGGALFCDYRYSRVFVYHNGAESYYAVRGFRGKLRV